MDGDGYRGKDTRPHTNSGWKWRSKSSLMTLQVHNVEDKTSIQLSNWSRINQVLESLPSHSIHTQFHLSSGPPVCFPSWGTRVQSPGGVLMWNRDSLGDPNVNDHCGLVWGWLHPEPSLGGHADNVIISHDLTQLFCPGFTLATGPPSGSQPT